MSTKLKLPSLLVLSAALSLIPTPGVALSFDRTTLPALARMKAGDALTIDAFPAGPTRRATIQFQKVPIYADGAHIYVDSGDSRKEIARSNRLFLRGYSDDGSARVAIVLNPDGSFASGAGSGPEGSFALHRGEGGNVNLLTAQTLGSLLPPGVKVEFDCANSREPMDVHALSNRPASSLTPSQVAAVSHNLRFAVVALDTDSKFMALFGNNTTSAANWIAGMFNTMNLMYERDLLVRLEIGTTIFRTNAAGDPYASFTQGSTPPELDTFASYWKNNYSSGGNKITRAFAALLSGAYPASGGGCGFSGLAWVNQYCQDGFAQNTDTVGSYSVDQVCADLSIDPDGSFDALMLGHELGHNFGAYHTHCTNATTGIPGGTNTIDKCFSGESVIYDNLSVACYSGPTSCPVSGPGAPAGTIMSYCNLNSCGPDEQNVLNFHPTQISDVLLPQIVSVVAGQPGCLNSTDDIFYSGFD
jgi:hypothetical protein